ncbi:hypothetical protein [Terasakiella pusilla]|uniref:hypothetical protein n=1 Tax=Terasakiella pusilla TaxID=64973 RepID=UPI003AA8AED6
MRKWMCVATVLWGITSPAMADDRQLIEVPDQIKTIFLEEMRGHLDNLNEITLAISAGDFDNAAFVAETKMGFGHSLDVVLRSYGLPEPEIEKLVTQLSADNPGLDHMGLDQFLPTDAQALATEFHKAPLNFAKVARSVELPTTAEEYQKVFTALSETIDVCSACHSTFKVE